MRAIANMLQREYKCLYLGYGILYTRKANALSIQTLDQGVIDVKSGSQMITGDGDFGALL
jgi:hypothetical protein